MNPGSLISGSVHRVGSQVRIVGWVSVVSARTTSCAHRYALQHSRKVTVWAPQESRQNALLGIPLPPIPYSHPRKRNPPLRAPQNAHIRERQRQTSRQLLRKRRLLHTRRSRTLASDTQWQGNGAQRLHLSGPVDSQQFQQLLGGQTPDGNNLHGRKIDPSKHRAATDYTFSAPKSVSIAALIQKDKRVIAAHDQAVKTALQVLEARYAQTRIRRGPRHSRKSPNRQHHRGHLPSRNEPRTRPAAYTPTAW